MAKKEFKTLDELFHDTLKDIYFAEKKILTVLPKMEKDATFAAFSGLLNFSQPPE
jgi:ferritin-like metal-binding protein YciE